MLSGDIMGLFDKFKNIFDIKNKKETKEVAVYDKGLENLPSNEQNKEYNLIETEVYKIIIE